MSIYLNKQVIKELLKLYKQSSFKLYIVPSIKQWLLDQKITEEKDDMRIAMTIIPLKVLLIKSVFDEAYIPSVTSGIWYRDKGTMSMSEINQRIGSMREFFIHTILHEIGHMRGMIEEKAADEWAFSELEKLDRSIINKVRFN